jgi:hypothetical protein
MEQDRPPIRTAPLSVVFLATTPEPIGPFMAAWLRFVEKAAAGSQLLVIADHLKEDLTPHARLRVVHHTRPMGVGGSLQTALWSAETPLVFFVPADGSFASDQTGAFLEHIDSADMVVGCRRAGPTPMLVSACDAARSVVGRIFLGHFSQPRLGWPGASGWRLRWAARRLFGVPLADPDSGVLLARREIFGRIPIQSEGRFAFVELIAKANHLGCLLDEVSVEAHPAEAARFGRDAWRLFRDPDFGRP